MPLYAQFDGDAIDGKFYALGDEISDDVDAGTKAYLVGIGRISETRPALPVVVHEVAKKVADMNRTELVSTALARFSAHLDAMDADEIRAKLSDTPPATTAMGDAGAAAGVSVADQADTLTGDAASADVTAAVDYASVKDKQLSTLTTAALASIAAAEGVTFGDDVKTNPDRVKAIQAKRDAAS